MGGAEGRAISNKNREHTGARAHGQKEQTARAGGGEGRGAGGQPQTAKKSNTATTRGKRKLPNTQNIARTAAAAAAAALPTRRNPRPLLTPHADAPADWPARPTGATARTAARRPAAAQYSPRNTIKPPRCRPPPSPRPHRCTTTLALASSWSPEGRGSPGRPSLLEPDRPTEAPWRRPAPQYSIALVHNEVVAAPRRPR